MRLLQCLSSLAVIGCAVQTAALSIGAQPRLKVQPYKREVLQDIVSQQPNLHTANLLTICAGNMGRA
jgi:hypothetical protein